MSHCGRVRMLRSAPRRESRGPISRMAMAPSAAVVFWVCKSIVVSSDRAGEGIFLGFFRIGSGRDAGKSQDFWDASWPRRPEGRSHRGSPDPLPKKPAPTERDVYRSEEHTSEL